MKDLGITSEDMKNSYFKQFIGTWEQAERRLKLFRETQKNLNERGSAAALNFVDYYSKLLVLELDAFIKKMIGYTNSTDETDIRKILEEAYNRNNKASWIRKISSTVTTALTFDPIAFFKEIQPLIPSLKTAKEAVKAAGKFLLNIAWKVATLIVQSPVFMEMAIAYFREVASDVCTQLLAKSDSSNVELLKTKGDLVQRLFLEDGKWKELSEEEKKKVAVQRNNVWAAALEGRGRLLLSILTEMLGNGTYKDTLQSFQDVYLNGAGGAIQMLIEAMEPIPIFGPFVNKVGVEKIKLIVTAHLSMAGKSVMKSMVRVNSSLNRVMRLYTAFFYGQSSLCGDGKFQIIDGAFDSVLRARFSAAFYTAMYNTPYYALMIVVEYAQRYANKRGVNKSETLDLLTEQLIQNLYVSGSSEEQRKADAKTPFASSDDGGFKSAAKKYVPYIVLAGGIIMTVQIMAPTFLASVVATLGFGGSAGSAFETFTKKGYEYVSWGKEEFLKYMGGPFMEFMKGNYAEGVKLLEALKKKHGYFTILGNILKFITTGWFLKKMYESVQESEGFWLAWEYGKRGLAKLYDFWNGSNGAYYESSVLPIWMVLKENKQHDIVFRMRMKELISKFLRPLIINLKPSDNSSDELYKKMDNIIKEKNSVNINFPKLPLENAKWLNVEEIVKFFKPYGSAITFFDFTVKEEGAKTSMKDVPFAYNNMQLEDIHDGGSSLKF